MLTIMDLAWFIFRKKLNIVSLSHESRCIVMLIPTKNMARNNGAVSKMSGYFESMPRDSLGNNGNELLSQTDRMVEKIHKQTPIIWIILTIMKNLIKYEMFNSSNMQYQTI